jgi:hypothetical protein
MYRELSNTIYHLGSCSYIHLVLGWPMDRIRVETPTSLDAKNTVQCPIEHRAKKLVVAL